MKIFTAIVIALIVALVTTFAALSTADTTYGGWPAYILAINAASLLVLAYFSVYGWLRKDKYILGSILFLLIDAGLKLAMLPKTNSFSIFWGVAITLSGYGFSILAFGVIRIAYIAISTRSNPFNLPAKTK
jgi:hypothetical protein